MTTLMTDIHGVTDRASHRADFTGDPATRDVFLEQTGRCMSLFDFPLFLNLRAVCHGTGNFDMRNLVANTLVGQSPMQAVTFVRNQDVFRHPEDDVADWLKSLADAVILLLEQGYPCVLYGDNYGTLESVRGRASQRAVIDQLLAVRRGHAYGPQQDYFDHENLVGWTRLGDEERTKVLAVVMSNGPGARNACSSAAATPSFTTSRVPSLTPSPLIQMATACFYATAVRFACGSRSERRLGTGFNWSQGTERGRYGRRERQESNKFQSRTGS